MSSYYGSFLPIQQLLHFIQLSDNLLVQFCFLFTLLQSFNILAFQIIQLTLKPLILRLVIVNYLGELLISLFLSFFQINVLLLSILILLSWRASSTHIESLARKK